MVIKEIQYGVAYAHETRSVEGEFGYISLSTQFPVGGDSAILRVL